MNKKPRIIPTLDFSRGVIGDIIILAILLVSSFYVVYFNSHTVSKVFFILLLILFAVSKKDYLWFAYFFIVAQGPGYFFADLSAASVYRLPFYTFLPGTSFTPIDLFVFLAFVKMLFKGRRIKMQLGKPLLLLLAYIIFTLLITSFLAGTNTDVIAWNARWLFYYSVIISFYFLVNKKQEIYSFILLIFPLAIFIFFTQLYFILNGNELINLFNPHYRGVSLNVLTGEFRAYMGGVSIIFFSFVFSLFMLVNEDCGVSKSYLYLIASVALLSVFTSATRQWVVVFAVVLLGYTLVSGRKVLSTMGIFSVILIVLSLLTYSGLIPLYKLLHSPWMRVRQIFDLAKGDIYSVDTAMNRLFVQLPIILQIIKQNPFIGYGFSNITMSYYDNDLGFVNTILIFGLFGFSLLLYLFVKIFAALTSSIRKSGINNIFRIPLKIIIITWIGFLIIYFSTQDFFTFYFQKVFFVSILIVLTDFFISQSKNEKEFTKKQITFNTKII